MYLFSHKDGWKEIDDILQTPGAREFTDELKAAGFSTVRSLTVGDLECGSFVTEVYRRGGHSAAQGAYEFLVGVQIGDEMEYIAVPKLPDLLALLKELVPLTTAIEHWAIAHADFKEAFEQKLRRGHFAKSHG